MRDPLVCSRPAVLRSAASPREGFSFRSSYESYLKGADMSVILAVSFFYALFAALFLWAESRLSGGGEFATNANLLRILYVFIIISVISVPMFFFERGSCHSCYPILGAIVLEVLLALENRFLALFLPVYTCPGCGRQRLDLKPGKYRCCKCRSQFVIKSDKEYEGRIKWSHTLKRNSGKLSGPLPR